MASSSPSIVRVLPSPQATNDLWTAATGTTSEAALVSQTEWTVQQVGELGGVPRFALQERARNGELRFEFVGTREMVYETARQLEITPREQPPSATEYRSVTSVMLDQARSQEPSESQIAEALGEGRSAYRDVLSEREAGSEDETLVDYTAAVEDVAAALRDNGAPPEVAPLVVRALDLEYASAAEREAAVNEILDWQAAVSENGNESWTDAIHSVAEGRAREKVPPAALTASGRQNTFELGYSEATERLKKAAPRSGEDVDQTLETEIRISALRAEARAAELSGDSAWKAAFRAAYNDGAREAREDWSARVSPRFDLAEQFASYAHDQGGLHNANICSPLALPPSSPTGLRKSISRSTMRLGKHRRLRGGISTHWRI
jgi:hypothetical protein